MTPDLTPLQNLDAARTLTATSIFSTDGEVIDPDEVRRSIVLKTGVSLLEWATMYVPLLAVRREFDILNDGDAWAGANMLDLFDLAARLKLAPQNPLGTQLYSKGTLTALEARVLDDDLYAGRSWLIGLRLLGPRVDALSTLVDLESKHLVDRAFDLHCGEKHCFVKIITSRLVTVLREMRMSDSALVSLDNAVLYV